MKELEARLKPRPSETTARSYSLSSLLTAMVVLIVNFTVRAGTEEQAKAFIRQMQENTRREPGCRLYIGQQSTEDPRKFCFYETYDDQAALEAHRAAPYFAEFVTNGLVKLMESRTQAFYTPVE